MKGVCLVAVAWCAGCSLVLDSGEFMPIPELEPESLTVSGLAPDSLKEGQGTNGRAIPIVIEGENIAPDVRVVLTGYIEDEPELTISADHRLVAFSVAIPVDTDLPAGQTADIDVAVSQGEGETLVTADPLTIQVEGLAELDATGPPDESLYSSIVFNTPLTLDGTSPFVYRATAHIEVNAELTLVGCAGGSNGSPGACGTRGGGVGTGSSGGGGGSNVGEGEGGSGNNGGAAGAIAAASALTPLSAVVGNGGGSGGNAVGAGGAGGAGGGAIELSSDGDVVVSADIVAKGADGDEPELLDCLQGGGGGGGSGGAVLVRALGSASVEASLNVAGGVGGQDGKMCAGGAGGEGGARVDTPSLTGAVGNAIVGPTFTSLEPIVTSSPVGAAVTGMPGSATTVNNEPPQPVSNPSLVQLTLQPGINEVCTRVEESSTVPEAINCQFVAYIPQL